MRTPTDQPFPDKEMLSDEDRKAIEERWVKSYSDLDDCFGDPFCEKALADIWGLLGHIRYLERLLADKGKKE